MRSIRIVTINLWNRARDAERRLEVLLPQLLALQPHVVTLQEALEREGGLRQATAIAGALGADMRFGAVDGGSVDGVVGNAIVSRLPINEHRQIDLPSRDRDRRGALRCELGTPAGRLSVVTTHLTWELDSPHVREKQVLVLEEFARSNPGEMPTVLTGDFNCTPDALVHQFLTGRASLGGRGTYWRDAFARRHPHSDGFTWSARNPYVARSVERNRRVDYVFVGSMKDDGPGAILHARVCLDLAGPDDVYPSDHFGVFAEVATVPVADGL